MSSTARRTSPSLPLSAFTIPMRGNEDRSNKGLSAHPSQFTIPMRGNEARDSELASDFTDLGLRSP